MHVLRVFLVPLVFIGGLVFFAQTLSSFVSSASAPCVIDACPRTIHEGDFEKVFAYASSAEFSVRLDERKNSYKDLHCSPAGVIETVSFTLEAPYYTVVFRGIAPGTCRLESSNFSAMITIQ